ncbi:SDR family NAD(P)-dependent oxidoreductase [Vibrio sp. SCSIO 43135]|uniref:SDR family NAD(P)-dependent oxidoreductase n=1 Tax=Vibrio paucivorans TaxID=2829489 RepID=A0A9X3CED9_9VIBR|nr:MULTISPECIES: SDR family NAD(P)-dependent oxidoreductase [Vibrio]MCW8334203.1 SDR family NAD(P)-dependent oxidoreductase [Vibrio paucivorans]USD43439.1 SDR family NAD(P)-dependent oxidoreductase [Vibrio sp. SCSIO 43135]
MNVLITGATSGIGERLAKQYAEQGQSVIACGRNTHKLSALSEQFSNIETLSFDLTRYDDIPQIDAELDLLVLNAGDCEYIDDALHFDASKFERVIKINLIAIGYALEKWLHRIKPGGRLVLVSSSAGLLPLPRAEAYGASKAALTYLAKTLSIQLKKHDIHVSVVLPGFVDTPLTQKNTFAMPMLISTDEAASQIIKGIEKQKTEISFPSRFIIVMKLLRLLPFSVWQKLATRMT